MGTRAVAFLAPLLILGGCDDFQTPTMVTLVGDLVAAAEAPAEDPVTGAVRLFTGLGFTEVHIEVWNQPPARRMEWSTREGRCDGSGNPLGPPADFPEIRIGEGGGTGGTLAVFNRDVPETADYAVEVFDPEGGRLACGNLVLP